jgi:hypothetical protein
MTPQLAATRAVDGTLYVDKASVLQVDQFNYDAIQREFQLLDERKTPSSLKDPKKREETARDNYLTAWRSFIEQVRQDLPGHASLGQIATVQQRAESTRGASVMVEINDALSALAGGDCAVARVITGSSPNR